MSTNIDIDEELLNEAKKLSHHVTTDEIVNEALSEFVRSRKQRKIVDLFGKIEFRPDYDYKAERSRH